MKANLNPNTIIEKLVVVLAFLPLVTMVYPETVAAAYNEAEVSGRQAIVFQLNSKSKTEIDNVSMLTYDQAAAADPLVGKVKAYLQSKGSPLAIYADEIVKQPQWQRALAISYVESNFGKRCANNNCSGIGVKPGHPSWRKYNTKLDWFKDMSALLEKPTYKEKYKTCAQMKGVYVVPGSSRWVNGCNQVSGELLTITREAEQERLALSNTNNTVVAATTLIEK